MVSRELMSMRCWLLVTAGWSPTAVAAMTAIDDAERRATVPSGSLGY